MGADPPDKPGYEVITLSDDDLAANAEIKTWADQGYEVVAFNGNRVILGNYKKNS